jgi:hypothetical protein
MLTTITIAITITETIRGIQVANTFDNETENDTGYGSRNENRQ